MKKEVLSSLFLVVFLTSFACAAVGVSPAYYDIDYVPNQKHVLSFNFYTDGETDLEIYSTGELTENVELNTKKLDGSGRVNVLLKMPSDIATPGIHKIFIGGKQISRNPSQGSMSIIGNIMGVIRVHVPYPGKYAELKFDLTNANAGDPVQAKLVVSNKGKDVLSSSVYIEIYDPSGRKIDVISLGNLLLSPTETKEINKEINTRDYKAGNYRAVAVVDYGDSSVKEERIFRLGELYINVSGHSNDLERDKINAFVIEAESFWNDPISDLYANVSIIGYNLEFLTPTTSIGGFGKSTLTGYFDTAPIEEDNFKAKITLNYEGKQSEQIVDLRFERNMTIIYIAIALAAIIIAAAIVIWRKLRKKKGKKNAR